MNAVADAPRINGGQNVPFGRVERQIARRYLGAKKSEGGVAVIAVISFICIMLAIWAMIAIMSIMNGFREKLIHLTIGAEGHMYVGLMAADVSPDHMADLEARLVAHPKIDMAFEFSENYAGLMANERLSPGRVIGISPEDLGKFTLITDNLQFGSLAGYGQGTGSEQQIAVGAALAAGMGLTVGDRIRIMTARTRSSAFAGSMPVSKVYTIGAIFETGLYQSDAVTIYMALDEAQLLFSNGKKSGEIQVRLVNPDEIDTMISKIRDVVGEPIWLETWRDRNSGTATALRTEQVAMRFIFVIVVIISTFPILAAMIMLVKNKARDIAILRTIGASRSSIMRIFFIAGGTIGVFGTVAGLLTGIVFCLNIDVVQSVLEALTGRPLFPPEVYGLEGGIPVKIVWGEVFGVAMCGFVISAIATFFPALSAAKTDPVEALRYE